jgi:Domain of unknown function (DUF4136)
MAIPALQTTRRRARVRASLFLFSTILAMSACNGVQVRTQVAPDSDFSGRTTFLLMRPPKQRGNAQLNNRDPMLVNSITYRRIHAALRSALESRGYRYSEDNPSMEVAYYATAQQKLDVRTWDYGYGWRRFWGPRTEVDEYEEGSVVVDVVDPSTHELLWRGQGRAVVSTDPDEYASQLEKAVAAIIAKFPSARAARTN